jgi:hypothetical protein
MTTAYDRDFRRACDEELADGLIRADVQRYLDLIDDGTYPAWLANFLRQGSERWSIYDGCALRLLDEWWFGGLISFAHVRVGAEPAADRMVDENNARLAGLPPDFCAEFVPMVGSSYCDDGSFRWTKPLTFEVLSDGSKRAYQHEPWTLPLEVGRTLASRTLLHIRQSGGVARWPYGSLHITVCLTTAAGRDAFGASSVLMQALSDIANQLANASR